LEHTRRDVFVGRRSHSLFLILVMGKKIIFFSQKPLTSI